MVAASACSRNKDIADDDSDYRADPIPIHVKNEGFLDVNVGVIASGVTRRLGTVTGNGSGDFKIAWSVANGQQVSMTATQIGGSQRYRSLGLSVRPGQMIEFRIGSVMGQSSAVVREP